jgi:hypothetical protein
VRRDLGQNEREAVVGSWFDSAEDVGERVALIAFARRSLSAREPAMTDAPLLPDARFILEKQAYLLVRMCMTNRLQAFMELF